MVVERCNMIAYGKTKRITANFEDCHPPKGYVNWWEDINNFSISKTHARQLAKDEIRAELEDLSSDDFIRSSDSK